jgi:hypothetical protein
MKSGAAGESSLYALDLTLQRELPDTDCPGLLVHIHIEIAGILNRLNIRNMGRYMLSRGKSAHIAMLLLFDVNAEG